MKASPDTVNVQVRLPADLRDALTDSAKANGRSMNAELVRRLRASFDAAPQAEASDHLIQVIKHLVERLKP